MHVLNMESATFKAQHTTPSMISGFSAWERLCASVSTQGPRPQGAGGGWWFRDPQETHAALYLHFLGNEGYPTSWCQCRCSESSPVSRRLVRYSTVVLKSPGWIVPSKPPPCSLREGTQIVFPIHICVISSSMVPNEPEP